jgi:hypothetical protein
VIKEPFRRAVAESRRTLDLAPGAISMMVMATMSVIRQNLDDPAFTDPTVLTFLDHSGEFVAQGAKLCQPPINCFQIPACDRICLVTRLVWPSSQVEKFADILYAKAEFTRMTDEVEPFDLILRVSPLLPLRPHRLWQ